MPVGVDNKNNSIETNKFYANFLANNQDNDTWTHPYSIWWSSDPAKQGHGLSISHTDRSDFVYGPGGPVKSFEDPAFRQSIALSARELQNGTVLTTDSLTAFSANVDLAPRRGAKPLISFPVVQGMAFVTGVYSKATVVIQSQRHFSKITDIHLSAAVPGPSVYGWSVQLGDGSSWLIYLTQTCLSERPTLQITDKGTILGPKGFTGTVQVAKNPAGAAGIDVFNKAAGVYPVSATISGTVSGRTGTYILAWEKEGMKQRTLLMFALPHHVKSFNTETARGLTNIKFASTTKGIATAILADEFTMVEYELPTDIGFDPWSPRLGSVGSQGHAATVSPDAKAAIIKAAKVELARDITNLTNLTSKYYGGIAFSVYARALYVKNEEPNPLCYDSLWKGLVSSASYGNNDSSIDFGNTYFNDHNFHCGYYVYTAAIIAHFDPSWLSKNGGVNKIWVNNLIRDWSNPSADDPFFPFSRSFDWFHGHSWARGVLEAADECIVCSYFTISFHPRIPPRTNPGPIPRRQCKERMNPRVHNHSASREQRDDSSLLLRAAKTGDLVTVTKLLTSTGNQSVGLNCQDETGATALSRAARMGRTEVVRCLFSRPDISVNCADDFGWTPLSWSARYGDHDVVQMLLAYPHTAADRADENGMTPLMFASRKGHPETVRHLLDSNRVDINLRDNDGRTALSHAAENDWACDTVNATSPIPHC
ncbi:glucan 1,3-beta-glucosidase [Fusarium bulbicola]|nr:glucan 1,3-beta-glucosidase [Fusarium bulbicola]